MAERLFWEELNPGDEAVSLNRTITEADVVNFCGVSGDFNWFHIDEVRASESVFGKRVAHGMLVTSVATGLQVEKMEPKIATAAFVGLKEWAVPRPGLLRRHDPGEADDRREVRAQEPGPGLVHLRDRGPQPGRQGRPEGPVEHADPSARRR